MSYLKKYFVINFDANLILKVIKMDNQDCMELNLNNYS